MSLFLLNITDLKSYSFASSKRASWENLDMLDPSVIKEERSRPLSNPHSCPWLPGDVELSMLIPHQSVGLC